MKTMTIILTDNEDKRMVSTISENKIKHITQTNQWEYVFNTILGDYNKIHKIENNDRY